MLVLNGWAQGSHRPAESRDFAPEKYAGSLLWRNRAVDRAERKAGNDFAGDDSTQRVGTADSAKCQVGKQYLRRIADCDDGRGIERIRDSNSLEGMMKLVTDRGGK